jgi:hypothetical protein
MKRRRGLETGTVTLLTLAVVTTTVCPWTSEHFILPKQALLHLMTLPLALTLFAHFRSVERLSIPWWAFLAGGLLAAAAVSSVLRATIPTESALALFTYVNCIVVWVAWTPLAATQEYRNRFLFVVASAATAQTLIGAGQIAIATARDSGPPPFTEPPWATPDGGTTSLPLFQARRGGAYQFVARAERR